MTNAWPVSKRPAGCRGLDPGLGQVGARPAVHRARRLARLRHKRGGARHAAADARPVAAASPADLRPADQGRGLGAVRRRHAAGAAARPSEPVSPLFLAGGAVALAAGTVTLVRPNWT